MNARNAVLVLVVLGALVVGFFALRGGDEAPAPEPVTPSSRVGKPVVMSEGRSTDLPVVTAAMPRGRFAVRKLTDQLDAVEAAYEEALPAARAALRGAGIAPGEDALILSEGDWTDSGIALLAVPIDLQTDAAALRALGFDSVLFEGGDAMSVNMSAPSLGKGLMKAEMALREAARADSSPADGTLVVEFTPGAPFRVTIDLTEPLE